MTNYLKLILLIIVVFTATVGHGQSQLRYKQLPRDIIVQGSNNFATAVQSALAAVPYLRPGNVSYKANLYALTNISPEIARIVVEGQLSIDYFDITMPDGKVFRFNYGSDGFVYSGEWPRAMDGTSIRNKKFGVSGLRLNNSEKTEPTYISHAYLWFNKVNLAEAGSKRHNDNAESIRSVDIFCSSADPSHIESIKNRVEHLREEYNILTKHWANQKSNTANNNSSNISQNQNSPRNNTANNSYNRSSQNNTQQTNSSNNTNRRQVDNHNNNIKRQSDQIYRNTQRYSRNVDQIVAGVKNQFDQWHQSRMAADAEREAEEEEEYIRRRREKEAEKDRDERERKAIISKREKYEAIRRNAHEVYKHYPSGVLPTSATRVNTNKLYYFIYAGTIDGYTGNEIYNGNAIEYVSNVFAIGQYPDGTWPMKTTIESEVRTLTKGRGVIHGYFISEQEAQTALDGFRSAILNAGMRINNITYAGKNANVQQQVKADNKQQALDYWGNPIKKTNATQPKQTATQPKQQTKKPKLDYWGNPIKE